MANIKVTGLNKTMKTFKKLEKNNPTLRRNTLNDMAFHSRKLYIKETEKEFTIRNKFTVRSIRVDKASKNPASVATTGSTIPYMAEHEFGKASKKITHIPTEKARISSSKSRVVRRPNYINRIGNTKRRATGKANVRQQVRAARTRGDRGPFRFTMNTKRGRKTGIFVLPTNKKRNLIMVHDITKDHISVKKRGLLQSTLKPTIRRGPRFFGRNLNRMLKNQSI